MRRTLALSGLALGLALSVAPSASAANPLPCETYGPQKPVCIPSWCFTLALVIDEANEALGEPLGPNPPPQCID